MEMPMRIVIGFTNPTKILAVKDIRCTQTPRFSVWTLKAGYQTSPLECKETIKGAINRARQPWKREKRISGLE